MKVRAFARTAALRLGPGEEGEVDGRLSEVRDLLDAGMIAKVEEPRATVRRIREATEDDEDE